MYSSWSLLYTILFFITLYSDWTFGLVDSNAAPTTSRLHSKPIRKVAIIGMINIYLSFSLFLHCNGIFLFHVSSFWALRVPHYTRVLSISPTSSLALGYCVATISSHLFRDFLSSYNLSLINLYLLKHNVMLRLAIRYPMLDMSTQHYLLRNDKQLTY